jgi:hypothetical protein
MCHVAPHPSHFYKGYIFKFANSSPITTQLFGVDSRHYGRVVKGWCLSRAICCLLRACLTTKQRVTRILLEIVENQLSHGEFYWNQVHSSHELTQVQGSPAQVQVLLVSITFLFLMVYFFSDFEDNSRLWTGLCHIGIGTELITPWY